MKTSVLIEKIKELQTGPEGETATEAVERLNKVIDITKATIDIYDGIDDLGIDDFHRPHCVKNVSEDELEQVENRLHIKFPPSYKVFVLKFGLIVFGDYNDHKRKMFLDCSTLSDSLKEGWDLDPDFDLSKEERARLEKIITFSYGDEALQSEWFHCFDFNTLNLETQEVDIVDFSQDAPYALVRKTVKMCQVNGFDCHMSRIVNTEIKLIVCEIEDCEG